MSERVGDWMQTYLGKQFWPLDPRPEEIHYVDIAHALSLQCRFTGHCTGFYSVAEHCVRISREVPAEDAFDGLMHDAAEAYLTDLCRPIKRASELGLEYMRIEQRLEAVIRAKYGLKPELPASVIEADHRMLMTEMRDLMEPPPVLWKEAARFQPYTRVIDPWTPRQAESIFLSRWEQLRKEMMK